MAAGASYLVFLIAVTRMDTSRFHPIEQGPPSMTPVRDGLRAVWGVPSLRIVLILFGVVSTFAFNYLVGFPLLVTNHLMQDEAVFGWVLSAMSIGNVLGALVTARLTDISRAWTFGSAAAVAVTLGALSLSPNTVAVLIFAVPLGMASAVFVNASHRSDSTAHPPPHAQPCPSPVHRVVPRIETVGAGR